MTFLNHNNNENTDAGDAISDPGYDFDESDPEDSDENPLEEEEIKLPLLGLRRTRAQIWKNFDTTVVFG